MCPEHYKNLREEVQWLNNIILKAKDAFFSLMNKTRRAFTVMSRSDYKGRW